MSSKSYKLLAIILILAVAALIVTGCGKSGSRFENQLPTISITSFEGWTYDSVPANIDTTTYEYTFKQKVFWHANDPDGIITGYAFRVLDENRQPIATPGYDVIATGDDGLIPDDMLSNLGEGWVIHYLPSADQSLALDDPTADRTIWSNQKYAEINLPAADDNGNPTPIVSYFEVVAMDNRGAVTPIPAWRKFRARSVRPVCIISTSKGDPNGGDVGSGITLRFLMKYPEDSDLLVSAIPYRFEFKMMKIDDATGDVIAGTETDWYSTEDQERITEYPLTKKTEPALEDDYIDDVSTRSTRIITRVVDLAGVYSDYPLPASSEATPAWELTFKVKPGFHPMTQTYSDKLLALGRNHFEDRHDDTTPEDLPFSIENGEQLFAAPLFRDMNGRNAVVHSENLKVYVRWGWWGEYGKEESTGTVSYPLDSPYEKKVDVVLSEPDPETGYAGGENYYGEVTHFDVRYDGEPYNFPPFAESIQTDDDGTQWLRLPLYSPLRQSIVLTGEQIAPGDHKFEVRCVDTQDVVSQYPAVFEFTVLPYVAPSERSKVLIIDDDVHSANNSPEDIVNAKYEHMTSSLGEVDFVKYGGIPGNDDDDEENLVTYADVRDRNLAFSDLQNYKLVIYHADNPLSGGTIEDEIDGLSLYLRKGGNLVISHTSQFASKSTDIVTKRGYTLMDLFGLPYNLTMTAGSPNPSQGAFFHGALSSTGYPDLHLAYSNNPDGDGTASFNLLVENFHGFSSVAYHREDGNGVPNILADPIYTYKPKPTDYSPFPPTQAQFDLLNGKVIGTRQVNFNGSRAYIFSFPLSYMQDDDAKALIDMIWSELM